MGNFPPHDPDDDDDDYGGLSALDLSYPVDGSDDPGLDVFRTYEQPSASDDAGSNEDGHEVEPGESNVDDHENLAVTLFTVTNPPETVTVTVFMDGRLRDIELAPKAVDLTERDLAEEILVIADLAAKQAKSAQYSAMLEGMREHGHDDAATRDFLTRDLDLLTPEQADAARAQVFSTRYGGDDG
ncbi:YbaB/EbfC family nucleoid-associated protein [Mycolicibacterium farcinogenes]|nr:YbaB/EbfC family nucleoid-associated protein [Mycolicibacterium farcinogenes]